MIGITKSDRCASIGISDCSFSSQEEYIRRIRYFDKSSPRNEEDETDGENGTIIYAESGFALEHTLRARNAISKR